MAMAKAQMALSLLLSALPLTGAPAQGGATLSAQSVVASAQAVRVDNGHTTSVKLDLQQTSVAADGHTRLILRLDGVRAEKPPGALFKLSFGPRDDEFIGYFNLYEARHEAPSGEQRSFDATAAFAAARRADDLPLALWITPQGTINPEARIKIAKISLIASHS